LIPAYSNLLPPVIERKPLPFALHFLNQTAPEFIGGGGGMWTPSARSLEPRWLRDSVIDKRRLIRRWIAEGFIEEGQGYTLYELGESCSNEVINRSLIQAQHINHYRNSRLCRVPVALPSAFYRALGKSGFAECRTRQRPALGKELDYRV
jgi:hypothetical protein